MTGATLFSGILAPECAMPNVDWKWCAEIESFPCSVIRHRRPGLINLGDVTAEDFAARAAQHGPIDLLVAGSPCQSFSVAGLRQSMKDSRGNLTLRLVELVHAIRPGSLLWENVPGVLSTPDNAFGCFLAGLVGAAEAIAPAAGWTSAGVVTGPIGTAAWRILDAQYFALAQRRQRLFLVFCFGDTTRPAEILFEFESMRRDYPPSREAREEITGTFSARTEGGGGLGTDFDLGGIQPVRRSQIAGEEFPGQERAEDKIPLSQCFGGIEVAPTLRAGGNRTGGDRPPGTDVDTCDSLIIAHSLRADGFDASEDGTGRGTPLIAETLRSHPRPGSNTTGAIIPGSHANAGVPPAVAFNLRGREGGAMPESADVASLRSASGGSSRSYVAQMAVRRLTTRECAKLQGFPQDWTEVPHRGKLAADGPQYKAYGNSMAVKCLKWLGERIAAVSEAKFMAKVCAIKK